MADNVTIKLSYKGIGQMLRGDEMKALVADYGERGAGIAGDGYSYDTHNTGQRQAATVFPADGRSANDNYRNNTLLKVINLL